MKGSYDDILSRIMEPPGWFDEHGVPRWSKFAPGEQSNIYASQVVLMLIECQACAMMFRVCLSWHRLDAVFHGRAYESNLAADVRGKTIHYGDPPNTGCCAAGPTMNSLPRRVLEFWQFGDEDGTGGLREWHRRPELEVEIEDPDDT